MIFDPPNLAKSPLRSDSIKILTKGLLHYSRKGVRMPKFRNFYRTSPEISTFFSLFSYSVSWQGRRGPFPWLEDCECKRARPPSLISGPWGPLFPLVVVSSARDNFNEFTSLHITCFYLFSGSGDWHWHPERLNPLIFSKCSQCVLQVLYEVMRPKKGCLRSFWIPERSCCGASPTEHAL